MFRLLGFLLSRVQAAYARARYILWPRVYDAGVRLVDPDILDVRPDGAVVVERPLGPAPVRPAVVAHSQFKSERSRRLARRAAAFLFYHYDFATVPSQYWPFLEQNFDPGRALEAFLAAVGCRSELVRARDAAELEKARDVIDLLVRSAGILAKLDTSVRRSVSTQLQSGDYATVRELAEVASHLQAALELSATWSGKEVFAAFADLLRTIETMLRDPLRVKAADASAAVSLVAQYTSVQKQFNAALKRYAALTDALKDAWPADWTGTPQEHELREQAAAFEHAEQTMRRDKDLNVDQLAEGNAYLAACLGALEGLLRAALGGDTGAHARPPPPPDETEDALIYFGFSKAKPPASKREFRAAWLKKMRPLHPDSHLGASDAEKDRFKKEWEKCERYNSLLLIHFSWH
ncbi:MAG TPA: hypothetical protein VNR39_06645 [Pseudolabrys sp.]|nr:hypothetical protein [Pseudolabrys sp.]